MTEIQRTFKLRSEYLEGFQIFLAQSNKKARKLGVKEASLTLHGIETVETKDLQGNVTGQKDYALITLIAEVPKFDGWKLEVVIDRSLERPLLRTNPGTTLNEDAILGLKDAQNTCDHCGKKRNRNNTYVVSKGDQVMQVGKNCLKDFLGHADPEKVLSQLVYLQDMILIAEEDADLEEHFGRGRRSVEGTLSFLATVHSLIRQQGFFVSKSRSFELGKAPTAEMALQALDNPMKFYKDGEFERPCETDFTGAREALEWVRGLNPQDTFTHNLQTVLLGEVVRHRDAGIAASVFTTLGRQKAEVKIQAEKPKDSEWVGTIGERIEMSVQIQKIIPLEGFYGISLMYILNSEGNEVIYKTSGAGIGNEGETVHIRAKVTKHGEYRGKKQTTIQRAIPV